MSSLMAEATSATGYQSVDRETDTVEAGALATTMEAFPALLASTATKSFIFSNTMTGRTLATNTVSAKAAVMASTRKEIEPNDVMVTDVSTVPHSESQWRPYVFRRLLEMQIRSEVFEPEAYPKEETLWRTWHLVNSILDPDTPTPSVVPSDEGGVRLVWHKRDWDVELEVEPNEVFVWARNHRTGETWDGGFGEAHRRLSEHLRTVSAF